MSGVFCVDCPVQLLMRRKQQSSSDTAWEGSVSLLGTKVNCSVCECMCVCMCVCVCVCCYYTTSEPCHTFTQHLYDARCMVHVVLCMCAAAQNLAMDVLVDVVKENITQFCHSLQLNSQHENHGRRLGFQVIPTTPCHIRMYCNLYGRC